MKLLEKLFGAKEEDRAGVDVVKTLQEEFVEQSEILETDQIVGENGSENPEQNNLLLKISNALASSNHTKVKSLVLEYQESYGHLYYKETFMVLRDGVWVESAPLADWCGDLETRTLFTDLCKAK